MTRLSPLILLALLALPSVLEAQGPRRGDAPPQVFTVGVRGGYDTEFSEPVLGLVTRVPTQIIPRVYVQGAVDWTFLQTLTEWQITTDVMYDLGGLFLGGGPVFRNSVWVDSNGARETRTGYSVFASLGGVPLGRLPFATGLEFRYVRVEDFSPTPVTIGIFLAPRRLLGSR